MKKVLRTVLPLLLCTSLIVPFGVGSKINASATEQANAVLTATSSGKRIVSYFPNWAVYDAKMGSHQVKDIPWGKVTNIHHGFWEISNSYTIQTTDSYADFEMEMDHSEKEDWNKYPNGGVAPGQTLMKGHFGEYKYFKSQNPNVKISISVGGWTRSEKFHDLAKSDANINAFTQSCVDTLKKYPFIDGIDIDWEYPGITREPEVFPGSTDRGAVGGPEDTQNFTKLLKMTREKLNANGMKDKLLTIAASAGEEKILKTEPDKYYQYLDYIGVMTYDFAGAWDKVTGNLAGLYGNPEDVTRPKFNMDDAMKIYRDKYGVPTDKLLAGSPLYSRGWAGVEPGPHGNGLYMPATGSFTGEAGNGGSEEGGGQYEWWGIKNNLEGKDGWVKYRDPIARTPFLYNAAKKQFISYEDEVSLQERCNYLNKNNYGGLIVWDTSGDDSKAGHPMHQIMYNGLINGQIFPEENFEKEDVNHDRVIDSRDISYIADRYNTIKGQSNFVDACDVNKDGIIDIYDLILVSKKIQAVTPNPDPKPDPGDDTSKDTYDPKAVYTGGQTVIYKGKTYKAKWWTQGEIPGEASVWELVA